MNLNKRETKTHTHTHKHKCIPCKVNKINNDNN